MEILTDTEKMYLSHAIDNHIFQLGLSLEMVRYPEQVKEEIQAYVDIAGKLGIELDTEL